MTYDCMDKGSDKCPCVLIEAGQCYVCGMIRNGKCNCNNDWTGVCPYTEYRQRGERPAELKEERQMHVVERKDFSESLTAVTLKVPIGYAHKCKKLGAFVMVRDEDCMQWPVPISVAKSYVEDNEGRILLIINSNGPKTRKLLKRCSVGSVWNIKGPFYSGILGSGRFNPKAKTVVAAKGIALMPLLNIKDRVINNLVKFFLDKSKLPEEFISTYLNDMEYDEVDMNGDIKKLCSMMKQSFDSCFEETGQRPNLMLMVSPYFADEISKNLHMDKGEIILPNHSNMCCGEGICGACSYTDKDGTTVRQCKCLDMD